MDIAIEFNNITFSGHDRKLAVNERKHRISLEQAAQAYFDPFAVRRCQPPRRTSRSLHRRDFSLNLLYVVHLQHSENDILIISARLQRMMRNNTMMTHFKPRYLEQRRNPQRPMINITMRLPEDVIDDLKQIAPLSAFAATKP